MSGNLTLIREHTASSGAEGGMSTFKGFALSYIENWSHNSEKGKVDYRVGAAVFEFIGCGRWTKGWGGGYAGGLRDSTTRILVVKIIFNTFKDLFFQLL